MDQPDIEFSVFDQARFALEIQENECSESCSRPYSEATTALGPVCVGSIMAHAGFFS
jgi:hypothetical protein